MTLNLNGFLIAVQNDGHDLISALETEAAKPKSSRGRLRKTQAAKGVEHAIDERHGTLSPNAHDGYGATTLGGHQA
jgi:hypothetical protein